MTGTVCVGTDEWSSHRAKSALRDGIQPCSNPRQVRFDAHACLQAASSTGAPLDPRKSWAGQRGTRVMEGEVRGVERESGLVPHASNAPRLPPFVRHAPCLFRGLYH